MSVVVSVYCLAYNHEKYIRKTLDGFVNQKTSFDFEVIVHDDASIDNTACIIKEYADKYPNIIKPIFQMENQYSKGISIFNEYILPQMEGKYIAVCEGDDFWCDENKLQLQVDFLEKHREYMAYVHNSYVLDERAGDKTYFSVRKRQGSVSLKEIIKLRGIYQTSSLLYRKYLADIRPGNLQSLGGIGDFPLALWIRHNGKIWYSNRCMSVYRRNVKGSWSERHTDNDENAKIVIEILKRFNLETEYCYARQVNKKINRLSWDILYRNKKIDELRKIGYKKLISSGYIGMACSVFLQLHNYRLYEKISKRFFEKNNEG